MSVEEVFRKLAAHTLPLCAGSCRRPFGCCDASNCEMSMQIAKDLFDVDYQPTAHPSLPMMGETGCIMAPHHRPLCTAHVCEIHLAADNEWTRRYWELREEGNDALEQLPASSQP